MNSSAEEMTAAVTDAVAVIQAGWPAPPIAGIVLGTGLGSLADHIAIEASWSYQDLPHFAHSTAHGHRGRLVCGRLGNVPIVAMDGRFHAYEGYSWQQITFPVRVMAALGIRLLIVSNASGGLNPSLRSGDILLIDDHVNLLWCSGPLPPVRRGEPGGRRGRASFYDPRLIAFAEEIASSEQIELRRGTYIAMLGPNYETPAEASWLRVLGDVVGMSTVPEVLTAAELHVPTIAFSLVTNVYRPHQSNVTLSEDVIAAAAAAEPRLRHLVTRLLDEWYRVSP